MKSSWVNVNIKREKLLFAFLLINILVYVFTPWRPLQLFSFFFIFIILFSRLYTEYLIRSIVFYRRDSQLRGFRHEWIDVELVVENRGMLPAFMLALSDNPGSLPVFKDNKYLLTLYGKRSIVLNWQGLGTNRGYFILGPGIVHGADPLGLFPFMLNAGDTTELFVYPSPAFIDIKTPQGNPLGILKSNNPFNEDLTRRRSVREYICGDEMRRINWRSSARMSGFNGTYDKTSSLMINEYEAALSYPLMIFLNADPAEYSLKHREMHLERAIEAAAALCVMASKDRQALGLILYSSQDIVETITPSAHALIPVLERLALFEQCNIQNEQNLRASCTDFILNKAKTLPFGTRLVYTGPALDEEDIRLLDKLKNSHISMEYLFIDEKILPYKKQQYQIKDIGYEIL